jgi:hypothetical protein
MQIILNDPHHAESMLGKGWWSTTHGSCVTEAQFPIAISYNPNKAQNMRIMFHTIALKSLDGTVSWKTKPLGRKQRQLEEEKDSKSVPVVRPIFTYNDL